MTFRLRSVGQPAIHLAGMLLAAVCHGVTSSPSEMSSARLWFDTHFRPSSSNLPSISVAYEDVPDGITRGRSWRGTAYQIGEKTYTHGVAFNSVKHLLVRTGERARRFVAEVGLENNDDTRRGEALAQGSVVFEVRAGGKELFKSQVMRRATAAIPVDVPLKGATEFELRVDDTGDGRGWDQALWAEAAVILENGSSIRLQDLPLSDSSSNSPVVFSFKYRGTNSETLLRDWAAVAHEQVSENAGIRRVVTYHEPGSGIEARVDAVLFTNFPAVEWTVHFFNKSLLKSPILESIQAFDSFLPAATSGDSTLHWARGGVASFDDFAPQQSIMKRGTSLRLQPGGGRSSSQVLPFFNLEGANQGVISAIGWTGEWLASFEADGPGVRMKAGMELTKISLEPGEEIRTPRMLMLFYDGDRWRGQNLLRQFILAHHRPRPAGQPLGPTITCGNWGATLADVHLKNIQSIINHDLPVKYYWIDAGWFGKGDWYPNAGNWDVNASIYPAGFKPLSTTLRANGRELMLWFEPERVFRGTTFHKQHPEYLVGPIGDNLLFNIGNPAARKFLTDFICARIREFGIGCYRQDFNFDPLPFWRSADAPDRQGITEIRYIEGLYAFWDELLDRNPGLIIDNCASGGRRLDLETVGRATPFWRTDGPRDPIAHQCHTMGLLPWIPLSATSQDKAGDDYEFRSSMCSALCLNWWGVGDAPAPEIPADFPFAWAKSTLDQYLQYRDCYLGDFYPLTSYSQSPDVWTAYQLHRPDAGKGLVVALRRPQSPYAQAKLKLKGLDRNAKYTLRNYDGGPEDTFSGTELLEQGLTLTLGKERSSALLSYAKQ